MTEEQVMFLTSFYKCQTSAKRVPKKDKMALLNDIIDNHILNKYNDFKGFNTVDN